MAVLGGWVPSGRQRMRGEKPVDTARRETQKSIQNAASRVEFSQSVEKRPRHHLDMSRNLSAYARDGLSS
jgi:hypothetical protein